jgi:hypothetical protein
MSTARSGAAAATVNGIIYAIGGGNTASPYLATIEAYDPATNTWTTKASMSTIRNSPAAVSLGSLLYAIGGHTGISGTASVEAYDPATNTWAAKSSMATARFALAATVIGGTIYAMGGFNALGDTALASVEAGYVAGYVPPTGGPTDGTGFDYRGTTPPAAGAVAQGSMLAAPNVLDPGDPASKVVFTFKGNAGGQVDIDIYDEAGLHLGVLKGTIDGTGVGSVTLAKFEIDGRKLGTGVYYAVAKGGGVSARRPFAVVRRKK